MSNNVNNVYVLRNYNKFLVGKIDHFYWADFFIHRFRNDYKKLLKFNSPMEAQEFLDNHPEVENDFDTWISREMPEDWK